MLKGSNLYLDQIGHRFSYVTSVLLKYSEHLTEKLCSGKKTKEEHFLYFLIKAAQQIYLLTSRVLELHLFSAVAVYTSLQIQNNNEINNKMKILQLAINAIPIFNPALISYMF